MRINLSPKQADIVQFDNGALLVKAGPGSGKTRVVIERIKRLLFTHKRTKILALIQGFVNGFTLFSYKYLLMKQHMLLPQSSAQKHLLLP